MEMVGTFSGLEEDLAALEAEVKNATLRAGTVLQEDMKSCLTEHLVDDVYDAYTPKSYFRRLSDGGLLDINKNTAGSRVPTFTNDGVEIELRYEPDGRTNGLGETVYPHLDGDELISRIENKSPDYNWNGDMDSIPERPFFRNFVEEMIEGRRAENTLAAAMNAADPTLEVVPDGDVIRESDDWH